LWTLIIAVTVTGISFFYPREDLRGFPFSFAQLIIDQTTGRGRYEFNFLLLGVDLIFWWVVFSVFLLILKNYVFDL